MLTLASIACGPRVGPHQGGGASSEDSGTETHGESGSEISWAIGEFTMLTTEPAPFYNALEVLEEGRAIATQYSCNPDGPAEVFVMTEMQWRAVSDTLIEFIPPASGEKILYGGGATTDLFIERPTEGDGITVYSSVTNEQWPRYGSFVRGRPCGYFEGGMDCQQNFYFRLCRD